MIDEDHVLSSEHSYYQAPELSDGSYGYHCDLWSLGIIFLEILLSRRIKEELSLNPL